MEKIQPDALKEFALIASEKLPPSPINLDIHKKRSEQDPVLRERLQHMIDCCFAYTKDVAHHEYISRSEPNNLTEITVADGERTKTHNDTIDAITKYRNMLEDRGLVDRNDDVFEMIPTQSHSRAHFGKFALLLTLNRFKEQIIFVKRFSREDFNVDYNKLKQLTRNEKELLIIEYVRLVSNIYENEDLEKNLPEVEEATLHEIEKELELDEDQIFSSFINIYERGYPRD